MLIIYLHFPLNTCCYFSTCTCITTCISLSAVRIFTFLSDSEVLSENIKKTSFENMLYIHLSVTTEDYIEVYVEPWPAQTCDISSSLGEKRTCVLIKRMIYMGFIRTVQ